MSETKPSVRKVAAAVGATVAAQPAPPVAQLRPLISMSP